MECMDGRALKSSFSVEVDMNSNNPESINEDFWSVTSLSNDEFSVDQFFDLSNEDFDIINEEDEEEKEGSFSECQVHDSNSTQFSTDLAIPVDDVQELELWSHLMDDSIKDPLVETYQTKTMNSFMNRVEPVCKPVFLRVPLIPSAVPVKPRSKRSRTNVNRSWVFCSSPKTESSSSSSPSSSPVSTLFFPPPVYDFGIFFKKPLKKPKKKPVGHENPPVQRRCTHCQVTKTPQWRAGPTGPKTLCNACGVRFKSGRLFPEYRPACSPTFSSEIHSNSHRKVLEMRKKKEGVELISGSTPMVLSS